MSKVDGSDGDDGGLERDAGTTGGDPSPPLADRCPLLLRRDRGNLSVPRPRKRIDYIFCTSHFRVLEASVVAVEDCASDHLPVRCLLDWSKDEAGSGIMGTNRRAEWD